MDLPAPGTWPSGGSVCQASLAAGSRGRTLALWRAELGLRSTACAPALGLPWGERGAQHVAGRVVWRRGDPSLTLPCDLSLPVPLHQPPHGRQVDVALPVVLLGHVPVVRTLRDAGFLRPDGSGEAGLRVRAGPPSPRGRRCRLPSPWKGAVDGGLLCGGFRSRASSRPRLLSVIWPHTSGHRPGSAASAPWAPGGQPATLPVTFSAPDHGRFSSFSQFLSLFQDFELRHFLDPVFGFY